MKTTSDNTYTCCKMKPPQDFTYLSGGKNRNETKRKISNKMKWLQQSTNRNLFVSISPHHDAMLWNLQSWREGGSGGWGSNFVSHHGVSETITELLTMLLVQHANFIVQLCGPGFSIRKTITMTSADRRFSPNLGLQRVNKFEAKDKWSPIEGLCWLNKAGMKMYW